MPFSNPNYTQTPNELFDVYLKELKGSELKILLVVIRKTLGFCLPDGTRKKSDKISISQIIKYTGLGRVQIVESIKNLETKHNLIETVKSHRKTTEFKLKFESPKVQKVNPTVSETELKNQQTSSESEHTKESNINKSTKEIKSDATHLEKHNNDFSIHKEIQKIYEKGFFKITKEKIDFTGKNGKIIGSHIKSLIVKGENKYRSIYIKSKKQRLAYLEIRRRSAILFKLIDGGDKYFGGFEFLPWVLVKFWNKFAIEKVKLTKKELKETEIDEMVKSI